ncbi:cytochrome c biogenesis CcdA family protein [Planctomycetota bacterium]
MKLGRKGTRHVTRYRCLAILIVLLAPIAAAAAPKPATERPVIVDYFFQHECPECEMMKYEVFPVLSERFPGQYVINKYDLMESANVVRLIAYQTHVDMAENAAVSVVVDYRYPLAGIKNIREWLPALIEQCLEDRNAADWTPPEPIPVPKEGPSANEMAEKRMDSFTLWAVIAGGLTDGINPCAISTLVFFISLLSVAKVSGRKLLLMGISFCVATFVTYTAIGFGLLSVLHGLKVFPAIQTGIDVVMVAALAVFAVLSFRDAYRFEKSGDSTQITLQVPEGMKQKMHRLMKKGLGSGSLILGGLFVGMVATAFESICTGQVYVPILILVIKTGESILRAWAYLLLYNAMFLVPIVAVLVISYQGLKTERLIRWSRTNVVVSKLLLGLFFLAMIPLILLL